VRFKSLNSSRNFFCDAHWWLSIAMLALLISPGQVVSQQNVNPVRPLIQKYCAECHIGDEAEGGFELGELDADKTDAKVFERWEEVANALEDDYIKTTGDPMG